MWLSGALLGYSFVDVPDEGGQNGEDRIVVRPTWQGCCGPKYPTSEPRSVVLWLRVFGGLFAGTIWWNAMWVLVDLGLGIDNTPLRNLIYVSMGSIMLWVTDTFASAAGVQWPVDEISPLLLVDNDGGGGGDDDSDSDVSRLSGPLTDNPAFDSGGGAAEAFA